MTLRRWEMLGGVAGGVLGSLLGQAERWPLWGVFLVVVLMAAGGSYWLRSWVKG